MQVAEFPFLYPCSTGHFCAAGCCQSPIPFFYDSQSGIALIGDRLRSDDDPEVEEDLPLVWEHQRLESTALSVMHKKRNLPDAPTKLARGKYTWDDDFSGRSNKRLVALPNVYNHYRECNERTMLTPRVSPQVYQKSGIPPSETINPEVHRKHIVRKIIKSPRGTRETKLVEEDGKISYYVNGVPQ